MEHVVAHVARLRYAVTNICGNRFELALLLLMYVFRAVLGVVIVDGVCLEMPGCLVRWPMICARNFPALLLSLMLPNSVTCLTPHI